MTESENTVADGSNSIAIRARQLALTTPAGFLAFGFGSGLLTKAPGTMGTLAAVPLAILLKVPGGMLFWLVLLVMFLAGVWLCGLVTKQLGVEDYGGIVWDEIVGYCLTVAFVPLHLGWLLAGFVLFRFFDIVKPWPISELENTFEGGIGIMLDDVAAAVYAMILLGGANYVLSGG
jgi:phosphatidylglycerophosphatase A